MNTLPNIRRLLLWLVVTFGVAAGAGIARAGGGLPIIVEHSKTEFAVYKGDTVALEVQAKGQDLQYKWMAKNIICREKTCTVDTDTWGLGTHKIAFVVFNGEGSLYLRYRIKVLAAPAGYKPGRVTPPVEGASDDIESVASVDLGVRTLTGRGFSYHQKKLQIVGPTPRSLDWREKLKTQDESSMQILREGQEQHVLGPSTAIALVKADTGRRVLVLNRGVLRSRQLDGKEPLWSIVYNNWLQVDTDAQGDVLINTVAGSSDQAELYVVRGNARVFRRRSTDGKDDEAIKAAAAYGTAGEAITVPQGAFVRLNRDFETPPRIEHPLSKTTGALIAVTTPLYLPSANLLKEAPGTRVLGKKKAEDLSEGTAIALDALGRRDFPAAMEALQPFGGDVKKDYRAALAMGAACKGLLFDEEASAYLAAASQLKSDAPEPYFLMGEIELAAMHWRKALKFFERADDQDYNDSQLLTYYTGVARFYLREYAGARSDLTKAVWADDGEAVARSAEAFRRKVKYDGWFDVRSGVGALYNSNVLRAGDRHGAALPDGIQTTKSTGYEGHAGFSLWAYRGQNGEAGVSFDTRKIGWTAPTLIKVNSLAQTLSLNLGVNSVENPEEGSVFELHGTAYVATYAFGDQRSMDAAGVRAQMLMPPLAGLEVHVTSVTNVDPLPGRDDILDPLRGEIVEASERSNHQMIYGFGITPFHNDQMSVGVAYDSASTVMRSEFHLDESYAERLFGVKTLYERSTRSSLGLDLGYRTRAFDQATDGRSDKAILMELDWRWHFTTSLYHDVVGGVETQTSTRTEATYKKLSVGYHLSFDL